MIYVVVATVAAITYCLLADRRAARRPTLDELDERFARRHRASSTRRTW